MRAPQSSRTPGPRTPKTSSGGGPTLGLAVAGGAIAIALVVLAVVVAVASGTCNPHGGADVAKPPAKAPEQEFELALGIAFDLSGSVQPSERTRAAEFIVSACKTVVQDRAHARIWEYAETCDEIKDIVVERSKDLFGEIKPIIPDRKGVYGTKQALPLAQMEAFIRSGDARSSRIVLALFTDGETHDSPSELRKHIDALASEPTVRAVLIGPLMKENREKYRELFAPFGERLVIFSSSSGDMARAMQDLERLLRRQ